MNELIKASLIEKFGNSIHLSQYIELCSNDDESELLEGHHILPKHEFPEFENFDINPWNKVNLTYQNHVKAHYLYHRLSNTFNSWYALMCMMNMRHIASRKSSISDDEILSYIENADTMKFREGLSNKMKSVLSDPLIRKKISDGVKKSRTNQCKENISKSITLLFEDEAFKNKHQRACQSIWESDDFKLRHKQSINEFHSNMSPETRSEISAKIKSSLRKGDQYKSANKKIIYDKWVELGRPGQTKLHTQLMKSNPEFREFIPTPNKLLSLVSEFKKHGYIEGH